MVGKLRDYLFPLVELPPRAIILGHVVNNR